MVKMTYFQFGQSSAGKISPKASWLIREAKEYVRLSFNKQRNEVTMLKEMIENIFKQDKDALETIETSMGEDVVEQYPKIPTDIDTMISNIENTEGVEFEETYVLDGETKWGGIKFPKGSNVMVFRVMDVKVKRRKIYRLGDYYVNLIHSGLSKWDVVFFTKSRALVYNDN